MTPSGSSKRLLDENNQEIAELLNPSGTKKLKLDDSFSKSGSPSVDLMTPTLATPVPYNSNSPGVVDTPSGGDIAGLKVEDILAGNESFFARLDTRSNPLLENNISNNTNGNRSNSGSLAGNTAASNTSSASLGSRAASISQVQIPIALPKATPTPPPPTVPNINTLEQQQQQQQQQQQLQQQLQLQQNHQNNNNNVKPPALNTPGVQPQPQFNGNNNIINKSLLNKQNNNNLQKRTSKPSRNEKSSQNPEELADAVAAAGVNLKAEEDLMTGTLGVSKRTLEPNNFLKPQQLAWFMNRVMEEQGLRLKEIDPELMNIMSVACETYMSNIITDTIIMSRHRRVPLATKQKHSVGSSKSDVSKALRDIATKQKEREEKRVKKRIILGLEEEKKDEEIAEEHKQTNVTASLMMGGSKKKKYSWMQSGSSKSNSISSRGDNGIRYREAREEPGIVLRDLLAAIENRRIGVQNTIVKGYSKMRD